MPIISKSGCLNLLEPSRCQIDLHRDCLALVRAVARQCNVEPKIRKSIPAMRFSPSRKPSHKFWNQIRFVVIGYQNLFLMTTQSGHEAVLSPPSSDVVKNEWNCTSTYYYVSMLCTGENFLYILLYSEIVNALNLWFRIWSVCRLSGKAVNLRLNFLMLLNDKHQHNALRTQQ